MVKNNLLYGGYGNRVGMVLLQNGGFFNTWTMKRCLHRKVDFKTNALNKAHVYRYRLSYGPVRLHKLAESIPLNQFLGIESWAP